MLFFSLLKSLHYIARMLCSNTKTLRTSVLPLHVPLPKSKPSNASPKPMPCYIPYVMMPSNSI
jgi:hypothetical protein